MKNAACLGMKLTKGEGSKNEYLKKLVLHGENRADKLYLDKKKQNNSFVESMLKWNIRISTRTGFPAT